MTRKLTLQEEFHALLRMDFLSFLQKCFVTLNPDQCLLDNWHIAAIRHQLEACRTGRITRLVVNIPPRSLKSQMITVAYVAWVLGHDPTKRIICVSYAEGLSLHLAGQFRTIVSADWFRDVFPHLRAGRDTDTEFETTAKGFRLATSVGGTLTGRGADLIIIDDPLKPEDSSRAAREGVNTFYSSTLYSRLNDKQKGVIILVMQRLHHEDLSGHLLRQGGWIHLSLPAIATIDEVIPIGNGQEHHRRIGDVLHPEREPLASLETTKGVMGSLAFQAQYQQAPIVESGNVVRRDWFKSYDIAPTRQPSDHIVQSWDTAMKDKAHNDYSVCTTWLIRNETYWLLDVVRRHCQYPELLRLIVDQYGRQRPDTLLIEEQAFGTALVSDLRRGYDIYAIPIKAQGDKLLRFDAASPAIEAGQVVLPKDAPWLGDFLDELLMFPQTRFDDQVDSVSQFLNWRRHRPAMFEVDWGP